MVELKQIAPGIKLFAVADGLLITGISDAAKLSVINPKLPALQVLIRRLPSLISDGLLTPTSEGLHATIGQLADIEKADHDPFESVFEWSPYSLTIQATGTLGYSDFKFVPRFYSGKRLVPVKTVGVFVWRRKVPCRLPTRQAIALQFCAQFNQLRADARDKWAGLKTLHALQKLSEAKDEVQLDDYLTSESVVMPEKVGLGVDDDGRFATAYPKIDGVSETELKRQFLNISQVQNVYDIEIPSGRKRVVISPQLQNIFRAIKRHGFGMSGQKRESFYRNPRSILPEDEAYDPDLIELEGFGPRVIGIGYPTFVRAVSNATKENWFDREKDRPQKKSDTPLDIECEFIDGNIQRLHFKGSDEAKEFVSELKAAKATGKASIDWESISIPVSDSLIESCENVLGGGAIEKDDSKRKTEKRGPKSLIIHTNADSIDYSENAISEVRQWSAVIPQSILKTVRLKKHQHDGLHWLQNLIHHELSRGGLLADEMGLGKTLQLLALSAWCIESELKDQLGGDLPPYHPILVVAPLILVDVWRQEIEKYFDGGVFQPCTVLHGPTIKEFRCAEEIPRELESATATLNLEKIKQNRLIITNYDTVKNYQYSFAKVPWSLVIVDEAQEIKEPGAAITHALKALNPRFRIASTGTPVETSLTNLWSVMDFVQPGNRLGSMRDFNREFGRREYDDPALGRELRDLLGYNISHGLVMRRTKKNVLKDLPEKNFIIKECPLTDSHRDLYVQIIEGVKKSKIPQAAILQGLHKIADLAQHPFLLEDNPFREDHHEYLRASTKLSAALDLLKEVRNKGEKALIFTRSRDMQEILKVVLDKEFGLDVKIINGSTTSRHQYVANTRMGIVETFSQASGFQVLILSPEVAGVGLTITAANHVIHYGRWWNPAKENQATDRAYRIGQTRPVSVYHLVYRDTKGKFETFDEKLHRLLRSREELADNFLSPSQLDGAIQEGLAGDIFGSATPKPKSGDAGRISEDELARLTPFEFEALTALLLASRFEKVLLTPRSGDRGVDVVGVSAKEIALIQCKHRLTEANANAEDAIEELIDGQDYYREHLIPKKLKSLPIRLIVVLSGKADKSSHTEARRTAIELLDHSVIVKLLGKAPITTVDLKEIERARVQDLHDLFL
jgi:SNF2 family DNA or RNA helicase